MANWTFMIVAPNGKYVSGGLDAGFVQVQGSTGDRCKLILSEIKSFLEALAETDEAFGQPVDKEAWLQKEGVDLAPRPLGDKQSNLKTALGS